MCTDKLTPLSLYTAPQNASGHRVLAAAIYKNVNISVYNATSIAPQAGEPTGLLPYVEVEGTVLSQGLAIIDLLDVLYPDPALFPANPISQARLKSVAHYLVCDIHPLNNVAVHRYLQNTLDIDSRERQKWYRDWYKTTLPKLNQLIEQCRNLDSPQLAGFPAYIAITVFPQLDGLHRKGFNFSALGQLHELYENGMKEEALNCWPPQFTDAESLPPKL